MQESVKEHRHASAILKAFTRSHSEAISPDNKLVSAYIYRVEGGVSRENRMIDADVPQTDDTNENG